MRFKNVANKLKILVFYVLKQGCQGLLLYLLLYIFNPYLKSLKKLRLNFLFHCCSDVFETRGRGLIIRLCQSGV